MLPTEKNNQRCYLSVIPTVPNNEQHGKIFQMVQQWHLNAGVTNSSLAGLKAHSVGGIPAWYYKLSQLLVAGEAMEPRGKSTTAKFLTRAMSNYILNTYPYIYRKVALVLIRKAFVHQMEATTESHNRSKGR